MKRSQSKASAPFLRRITLLSEKADPARHPFNIEALRGLDLELDSRVTFFVGENGSGKSTLLEAVAQCCGFNVQGGGRDHQCNRFQRHPGLLLQLVVCHPALRPRLDQRQ